jgi:hypothetical protein
MRDPIDNNARESRPAALWCRRSGLAGPLGNATTDGTTDRYRLDDGPVPLVPNPSALPMA